MEFLTHANASIQYTRQYVDGRIAVAAGYEYAKNGSDWIGGTLK
jgi:hypothetical protein